MKTPETAFKNDKRWVNWRFEERDGKRTKIPCTPDGRNASSTDPETWSFFDDVLKTRSNFDGLGIVFTEEENLLGIDFDHCLDDKFELIGPNAGVIRIMHHLANTYTEISPSGTGLHMFLQLTEKMTLKGSRSKKFPDFECYTSGRYFTFTGNPWGGPRDMRTIEPAEAERLLCLTGYPWADAVVKPTASSVVAEIAQRIDFGGEDGSLLGKMFSSANGAKIKEIYDGDISSYENDDSSADMAFLLHLAFWTQNNAEQMERLWMNSPLGQREKTQNRKDYRDRTIANAIKNNKETYKPPRDKKQDAKAKENVKVNPEYVDSSSSEDYEKALNIFKKGKAKGIPTGSAKLDAIIGGWIPGQSYLLFADTNVGKSLFMVNCLIHLARQNIPTVYFDLENSIEMTMERMMLVANRGDVKLHEWRKATDALDEKFIDFAMTPLLSLLQPLTVWDINKLHDRFGDVTWEGVEMCIREAVERGAKVIVLDHLHYFSPSETDHAKLGEVARLINNLCAVYNIAIVLVAHTKKGLVFVDKKGEVRASRPTVDHINGSTLIAKHIKNLISIRRNPASPDPNERAKATIYVDKTKYGPSGWFDCHYEETTLVFDDEKTVPKSLAEDGDF